MTDQRAAQAGRPRAGDKHVARQLHDHVADVENGHGDVELAADEPKVFLEGAQPSLAVI